MNEIIQSLECNSTNGKENFCYISEARLKAIKQLSTIENKEWNYLNKGINELIKNYQYHIDNLDAQNDVYETDISNVEYPTMECQKLKDTISNNKVRIEIYKKNIHDLKKLKGE